MAGFETVVRPVVFPNIRPPRVRVPAIASDADPNAGLVTMLGAAATPVRLTYNESVSVSRSKPQTEQKRQFDVERVYQKDKNQKINKDNFVDVERVKKLKLGNLEETTRWILNKMRTRDNVETLEEDITESGGEP